jgi:predicted HAD superfamily Cof-like phosphohydrolase|tara:strand:- start:626 stop:853 length:228 start_codon:yes stop_codon:yes gene_type:complete
MQNPRAREAALKELADLVYVCFQYSAAAGWELDVALDRVHKSNMSKLVDGKPLKREDGKVLKGPNYQPANLIDLV